MTFSGQQFDPANACIYRCSGCVGCEAGLTDEHVLPYGIGGNIVLPKSSCPNCATITGRVEQALLRGHWWPLRRVLGLRSRRSRQQPDSFTATRESSAGIEEVQIAAEDYPGWIHLEFDPPSILRGVVSTNPPAAQRMYFKFYSEASITQPTRELIWLPGSQNLSVPVNLEVDDVVRFLAKVALSYAVGRRGVDAFEDCYVRDIICGQTNGATTYIGGVSNRISGPLLPGTELHALMDIVHQQDLCVYIQLFRDTGDPPPIYQVVVGRLRAA